MMRERVLRWLSRVLQVEATFGETTAPQPQQAVATRPATEPAPAGSGFYRCGPPEEMERPGSGHYQFHRVRGERPCGKSLAESKWYNAERKAGHPLPDWQYQSPLEQHRCGGPDEAERPNSGHYRVHLMRGEQPCGKAKKEDAWLRAERYAGRPLPDWQPRSGLSPA